MCYILPDLSLIHELIFGTTLYFVGTALETLIGNGLRDLGELGFSKWFKETRHLPETGFWLEAWTMKEHFSGTEFQLEGDAFLDLDFSLGDAFLNLDFNLDHEGIVSWEVVGSLFEPELSWEKTAVIFNFENKMGATISQYTDLFYNEHIAPLEAKNYCRLEWGAQEAFLKKHNLWIDMKQGNIINNTARLVKEVSDNTAISRNILYLVGGVVSKFYEECMIKLDCRLVTLSEKSDAKDIIISELTVNLEVTHDMIVKLQQERINHICSSTQIPISIENSNMVISSGSISTNSTNDSSILKLITILDDQPIQPQMDQLQELMNLDNPDDELPKSVTSPPASISKVKKPNQKKNKELTPNIITGYTILPKLKNNVRDVMLYDIPGNWDAEKITEEINKHLGSLIKAKPDERMKLNERNLNERTKRKPDERMKLNERNLNERTKRKPDERMKPNEQNLNERTKWKLDEWMKPNKWNLNERTKRLETGRTDEAERLGSWMNETGRTDEAGRTELE
ncbi:hypothetical protein C1645_821774 [Glomus cerebriforme]|uniref:Uncharacterized protein n=1 Tax=Glomus cerebriforme TaxID=658196 RepID=A0A397T0B1_9GLOM|nr:hypothetical protein C1645_821774 [Glomus cerebriforme]